MPYGKACDMHCSAFFYIKIPPRLGLAQTTCFTGGYDYVLFIEIFKIKKETF